MIGLIGADGMLGRAIAEECEREGLEVLPFEGPLEYDTVQEFYYKLDRHIDVLAVINAAGLIPEKVRGYDRASEMVNTNAYWPNSLASWFKEYHFIHVSTDCVFNGKKHIYREDDPTNATDLYGMSKALGEYSVRSTGTVVRTSFIGPDHGLMKWFMDNRHGTVHGWDDVLWSGSTVWEVARKLLSLAVWGKRSTGGIVHMSTRNPMSKYEVLCKLRDDVFQSPTDIIRTFEPKYSHALLPSYEEVTLQSLRDPAILEEARDKVARLSPV